MNRQYIIGAVDRYYTDKLREHGATARGVDWNSSESQELRFSQLLKVCEGDSKYSLIDYGCGYGHLYSFMNSSGTDFGIYRGLDISAAMVKAGRTAYRARPNCSFSKLGKEIKAADYTVASGIFNVRIGASKLEWKAYVLDTLNTFREISKKGFSFNCLTKYSDRERMRPNLYYADPCFLFDYCKRNYSKNVALLHDYRLYEASHQEIFI